MDKAVLIQSLLDAAAPVIKSYWTDLRHDAKCINGLPSGSSLLWAPNECGTYLIVLTRGRKPNIQAAHAFAAMTSALGSAKRTVQWYGLALYGDDCGECQMVTLSAEDACDQAWKATRAAESTPDHVSEHHL